MNPFDFDGSAMCGRYLRVTGPQGTVDVRIVDLYPDGAAGDIDLNRPAFEQIAGVGPGIVEVTWESIADPDPDPVTIYLDGASGPWYTALQVRDHRYGIASLEYLGPSDFVPVPRTSWNHFVLDGNLGVPMPLGDPFSIRLTDVHGQTMVIPGIPIVPGIEYPTGFQFPECSDVSAATPRNHGPVLHGPVPNPFNPWTVLSFEITEPRVVSLRVFDVSGRLVRNLVDSEPRTPGRHEVVWHGRDDAGRQVGSGTYFCRLESGEFRKTRPMLLVK